MFKSENIGIYQKEMFYLKTFKVKNTNNPRNTKLEFSFKNMIGGEHCLK